MGTLSKGLSLFLIVILALSSLIMVNFASATSTISENSWVSKAPMPTARDNLGVAVVNGKYMLLAEQSLYTKTLCEPIAKMLV